MEIGMPTKIEKKTLEQIFEEIFDSAAGRHGADRAQIRQWFEEVQEKLERLKTNTFTRKEEDFFHGARAFRNEILHALEHPAIDEVWGKGGKRIVQTGLAEIVREANLVLDGGLSFMDITLFYQISDFGRKVFNVHHRSSAPFISETLFKFVEMVRSNYPVYSQTLKGYQI